MPSDNIQLFGGNWTEDKLAIVADYLKAYNTALQYKPFTRVYIDAFAGTGYRQRARQAMGGFNIFQDIEDAESQAFLKGSATRALEVVPAFHRYIFIESDPNKVAELKLLREA